MNLCYLFRVSTDPGPWSWTASAGQFSVRHTPCCNGLIGPDSLWARTCNETKGTACLDVNLHAWVSCGAIAQHLLLHQSSEHRDYLALSWRCWKWETPQLHSFDKAVLPGVRRFRILVSQRCVAQTMLRRTWRYPSSVAISAWCNLYLQQIEISVLPLLFICHVIIARTVCFLQGSNLVSFWSGNHSGMFRI